MTLATAPEVPLQFGPLDFDSAPAGAYHPGFPYYAAYGAPRLSSTPSEPAAGRDKPPFSEREYRDALAQFATGVTVICARAADGRYAGFTANSFNALSLDPPLVLWSLDWRANTLATFEHAQRYVVNVLAHDQIELAHRFSRPHKDRFAGVNYRLGRAHAPLIEGSVAWFECRHFSHHRVGDHVLFVGEVEFCERRPGVGLIFAHGGFATPQELPIPPI